MHRSNYFDQQYRLMEKARGHELYKHEIYIHPFSNRKNKSTLYNCTLLVPF
uniref:Uncharacterized protein n=1 Tax=Rhizophora mucronata TaxID=61149 RepID=A0A2P2Q4Y6_RHIMU